MATEQSKSKAKEKIIPTRLSGSLYYVEDDIIDDARRFQKELMSVKKDEYFSDPIKGSVWKNVPYLNRKLVFDIDGNDEYWPSTFIGFLYPGRKIIGRIRYIKEANLPEESYVGKYFVTKSKRIISFGKAFYSDQTFYSVCFELRPKK